MFGSIVMSELLVVFVIALIVLAPRIVVPYRRSSDHGPGVSYQNDRRADRTVRGGGNAAHADHPRRFTSTVKRRAYGTYNTIIRSSLVAHRRRRSLDRLVRRFL